MGLCEPIWSIRMNCQVMTKFQMKHILQAQLCNCSSKKNETGNFAVMHHKIS